MILGWLKAVFGLGKVSNQVSILDKRINKLLKERESVKKELALRKEATAKLEAVLKDEIRKTMDAVNRAEGIQRRLEFALEGSREQLKIANEIVIPSLVSAHKLVLDRWDAETAIQQARNVAANPSIVRERD